MTERKTALLELVDIKIPIGKAINQVRLFEWDSEEELVLMERKHIVKLLQAFVDGNLSDREVLNWANAVEGRDDIGIDVEFEDVITDSIFILANPEITEELTKELAIKMLQRLSS